MTTPTQAAPGRSEAVVLIIAALIAIYGISQFLRSSVGVIASDLARELGLSATEIGLLSSAFFFSFAAAQIPVGIAIDRYGPKRTMVTTASLAIAGTVLFAVAPSPGLLIVARILMGLGCSTFFMAPLAIYARRFPPERFALLTSLQMGFANLGTLGATAPLAAAAASIGWRGSFLGVAVLTAVFLVLVIVVVPGDRLAGQARESWADAVRGVGRAVRVRSFWPVFFAHLTAYSSFATVVGLWAGPWLSDAYGVDLSLRGTLILVGAAAQIAGLFAWGPTDRWARSYRIPVLIGGGATVLLLAIPALVPLGLGAAVVWLGIFGFVAAFTPILTAHGKALFPRELTGRGITLMNIGAIGGTFLSQSVTGVLVDLVGRAPGGGYPPLAYQVVFGALALWLLLSLVFYARAGDPHPSHAPGVS
ncbi:MAG TPA: MFS transporter [Microvirga sp.]|jgi:MFS family permease|nr:MFS transporter [Microvirga sp.]